MDERLIPVKNAAAIPANYLGSPIETLLRSHNLGEAFEAPGSPQLLVSMCMDHRKALRIPDNFSYILRNAGAYINDGGFMISYALTVGGVKTIAIIGHDQCGMAAVKSQDNEFINGLKNFNWNQDEAISHYHKGVKKYGINDEIDSVIAMAQQLREQYKNVLVVPMLYLLEDNMLYLIK